MLHDQRLLRFSKVLDQQLSRLIDLLRFKQVNGLKGGALQLDLLQKSSELGVCKH